MHNDIQPTAAPTGPALTPLQDLFRDLAGDLIARGAPERAESRVNGAA